MNRDARCHSLCATWSSAAYIEARHVVAVAFDDIDKVIDRHIIAEENVSVEDLCSRHNQWQAGQQVSELRHACVAE